MPKGGFSPAMNDGQLLIMPKMPQDTSNHKVYANG